MTFLEKMAYFAEWETKIDKMKNEWTNEFYKYQAELKEVTGWNDEDMKKGLSVRKLCEIMYTVNNWNKENTQ